MQQHDLKITVQTEWHHVWWGEAGHGRSQQGLGRGTRKGLRGYFQLYGPYSHHTELYQLIPRLLHTDLPPEPIGT